MPRRHRVNIHGGIYHVMSRGNRKGAVFTADRERRRFGRILGEVTERCGVKCYGGCLMENHYHLVVMTPRANLPVFTKLLNQLFTQYMNRRHGWTGHVLESRPTALLIDSDYYLLDALAYVARNPVVAGLVTDPAQWRWSTYASTIGLASIPDWLTLDWLDRLFPDVTRLTARDRFRSYVMSALVGDEHLLTGEPAIGVSSACSVTHRCHALQSAATEVISCALPAFARGVVRSYDGQITSRTHHSAGSCRARL